MDQLQELQEAIGYEFQNEELLLRSLTHPSYVQQFPEERAHNQRLEFLGDAALSLILAEKLYELLPQTREGILTRNRSALAKGQHLARLARELKLSRFLRLSEAEERNGGRDRDSILEDAFEALVGAIYLDSDWETARQVVLRWFGDIKERLEEGLNEHNPKGRLQEMVQPKLGNEAIRYVVLNESGPSHSKAFVVEVQIDGRSFGQGEGTSKKEAEENAARAAILEYGD